MVVKSSESKSGEIVVRSDCNMNALGCRVSFVLKNGKIVKVRANPDDTAAGLCTRTSGIMEWEYLKERVTTPLKRENGGWKEVTWDEALSFIADKLSAIKEKYGARALVVHTGWPSSRDVNRRAAKRFARAFGTPNFTSGDSLCFWGKAIGHTIALGTGDAVVNTDIENTKCVFVIGQNPSESKRPQEKAIRAAKARGAKLIVVDPRLIPLAKEADIYTPIRPGTDCALVLSLLNVIIKEKLYDKDFVVKWTYGFDKLVEHVKVYSPEKVEKITWVPADTIRNIARMYATNKPAVLESGVAMDHCTSGSQTNWALAILLSICGNFETPGGNFPLVRLTEQRNADQDALEESIGYQYPVFYKVCGESTVVPMADTILTGKPYPVKAFIVESGNPASTLPNINKSRWALCSLDLVVVMDLFMTETAKLADIVLPAANCLEVTHLKERCTFNPSFLLVPNIIEPRGDCWPDWKFWTELGKKMGYEKDFPWNTADEYFEYFLKPWGVTLNQLRDDPQHIAPASPAKDRSYRTNGFNTQSKKVEIYSEYLKNLGYDPLPTYREPAEGWLTKTELTEKYPLIAITGSRNRVYPHTQYRNLPSIRKLYPEPMVEINTQTAKDLNVIDGEKVIVESPRGSIRLKANVTDDIHPKVISIPHGWSEADVNILTNDLERDPITGFIGFKSVLCRIVKA